MRAFLTAEPDYCVRFQKGLLRPLNCSVQQSSAPMYSRSCQNFAFRWHMRYEQNIVFVGARYKHVRIHERYGSTYIPLSPLGCSPQLEQAPSARDPFWYLPTPRRWDQERLGIYPGCAIGIFNE